MQNSHTNSEDHVFRQAVAHKGELYFICSKKGKHRQNKRNSKKHTSRYPKNHRRHRT